MRLGSGEELRTLVGAPEDDGINSFFSKIWCQNTVQASVHLLSVNYALFHKLNKAVAGNVDKFRLALVF